MADFMGIVKGRRSIRKYETREIPEDVLNKVLEAVQWTPSWANTQCWEIILIKDPAIRARLQETLSKGNSSTRAITDAPAVLALCGRLKASGYINQQVTTKFGDWFMFDLGLAAQSLCLAAYHFGLGTVIVGLFDQVKAAEILKVPQGYELVCLIPLGYPAKDFPASKRREIAEFLHHDTF